VAWFLLLVAVLWCCWLPSGRGCPAVV